MPNVCHSKNSDKDCDDNSCVTKVRCKRPLQLVNSESDHDTNHKTDIQAGGDKNE
jgi:hypothetical protein